MLITLEGKEYYSSLPHGPLKALKDAILREDTFMIKKILSYHLSVNNNIFKLAIREDKIEVLFLLLELRPRPLKCLISYAIFLKKLLCVERLFTLYEGDKKGFVKRCLRIDYGGCYVKFKKHCYDDDVLVTLIQHLPRVDSFSEYVCDLLGVSQERIKEVSPWPRWQNFDYIRGACELYVNGVSSKYVREIAHEKRNDPNVRKQFLIHLETELRQQRIPPLQKYYSLSEIYTNNWWERTRQKYGLWDVAWSLARRMSISPRAIFFLHHIHPRWKGFEDTISLSVGFKPGWSRFSLPRIFLEEELELSNFQRLTRNARDEVRIVGELVLLQYRDHISKLL